MKKRRKAWSPRGHRALSPPELRVLGKKATEMPEGLGRCRVSGFAGLEPSARFCRVKFSDKNFNRPTLRAHLGTRSRVYLLGRSHACRRAEPLQQLLWLSIQWPLKRQALPGLPPIASAGWASTAPLALTLQRAALPSRVPRVRRALVAPEAVRILVSLYL